MCICMWDVVCDMWCRCGYGHVYVCMHTGMCVYEYVYVYVSVYVYVFVFVFVFVCM